MNFINFESVRDKEEVRQELRDARNELLRRAEIEAKKRAERNVNKELRGDNKWILPSISKKLKKSIKKKKKKESKRTSKKSKKKSKHRHSSSDTEDNSDSENDEKGKVGKKKKKNKKSKKQVSNSEDTSSSDEDEWVEKKIKETSLAKTENNEPLIRDEWMTSGNLFMKTYTKEKKETKKKSIDEYNPATSTRELNPHWKNNGDGLPAFQKPLDDEFLLNKEEKKYQSNSFSTGGWKKTHRSNTQISRDPHSSSHKSDTRIQQKSRFPIDTKNNKINIDISREHRSIPLSTTDRRVKEKSELSSDSESTDNESDEDNSNFLTDQQMNEIAAKIIKAEIMGNDDQIKSLKDKLEKARLLRNKIKGTCKKDELKLKKRKQERETGDGDHILLTVTDNQGNVRPFQGSGKEIDECNYTDRRKKKVETHVGGKRVRYFPDDERYDINQMFTREREIKGIESDLQFAEIAGKSKNPNDDLDDIFADSIRVNVKDVGKKQKEQAIQEAERLQKILDDCDKCFNTPKMQQNLMVSMGSSVYLSLPWYEGLQPGHCLIIPMQHTTCSTRLDEDVWTEITEYRKALTRMFEKQNRDVIFFEMARYLNRSPHMVIHCIPCKGEMAPFYFKKAIQESEQEWSTNKQLISLKEKDLRRSVPKGLPYFWVNFGINSGFAHVIEDQSRFPENYAQEIIGNMLQLDPRIWRKPRKEHNFIQKVKQFADWFKPYDFTDKT